MCAENPEKSGKRKRDAGPACQPLSFFLPPLQPHESSAARPRALISRLTPCMRSTEPKTCPAVSTTFSPCPPSPQPSILSRSLSLSHAQPTGAPLVTVESRRRAAFRHWTSQRAAPSPPLAPPPSTPNALTLPEVEFNFFFPKFGFWEPPAISGEIRPLKVSSPRFPSVLASPRHEASM